MIGSSCFVMVHGSSSFIMVHHGSSCIGLHRSAMSSPQEDGPDLIQAFLNTTSTAQTDLLTLTTADFRGDAMVPGEPKRNKKKQKDTLQCSIISEIVKRC
jgi:hypothetical protein